MLFVSFGRGHTDMGTSRKFWLALGAFLLLGIGQLADAQDSRLLGGDRRQGCNCLAFSPDGSLLAGSGQAVGSHQGQVTIWSVASGEEVAWIGDFPTYCGSLQFSPDGKLLVVACGERSIHVFRQQLIGRKIQWKRVARIPSLQPPGDRFVGPDGVQFSPDGRRLFCSLSVHLPAKDLSAGIQVWKTNPVVLERTLTPESRPIHAMRCLDKAGDRLLVAASPELFVVDVPGNEVVQKFSSDSAGGSIGGSFDDCIDTTGDLKQIAASGRGFLAILDPETLRPVQEFESSSLLQQVDVRQPLRQVKKQENQVQWEGVSLSSNGALLAASSGSRNSFQLWDVQSGKLLAEREAPMVSTVVFSPDGSLVATAASSAARKNPVGEVRVWDVKRLMDR
jgi:WD40 repeat protein